MFLKRILRHKQHEIAERRLRTPMHTLMRHCSDQSQHDRGALFRQAMHAGNPIALIAEVKKASPSKGILCPNFDPVSIAREYESAGAAAVSVLTDEPFFGGSLQHLNQIHARVQLPLLRKDFIIDPYQIYEAQIAGAAAVLLIVAALSETQLSDLLGLTHSLGMAALVEVHTAAELETALAARAQFVGINNRNLSTFETSLTTTERLAPRVPATCTLISESGITDHDDLARLADSGVHAVLVGEALMRQPDKFTAVQRLLGREVTPHGG